MVRRKIWSIMTRLQNAKKQLSEALVALESRVSQTINVSHQAGASGIPSRMRGQTDASSDLLVLVDEVSIIEAKLNETIAMIATVESGPSYAGTVESGTNTDGDTQ
jgi:hypothetical protein